MMVCSPRTFGLQLLLLVQLLVLLPAPSSAHQAPHFKYSQSHKIMLAWDDVWEVGVSNKLAFLNKDKRLSIRINVEGGASGSGVRKILLCRCSVDSGEEKQIDLASVQPDTIHCDATTPFKLSKLDETGVDYQFTLMDSKLSYANVFGQKIQLTVQVETGADKLLSNSLFVYNLDAISRFGSASSSEPGVVIQNYYKRYLTTAAVNFLVQMNMTTNVPFASLDFIDQQIISLIKGAPDFIRAKINIGTVLQFDAGDCQNFQSHLTSMFVNYYSKMNERNANLLKHMGLSLDDGKLYYSTYGLSTSISNFLVDRNPKEISICTVTSLAGQGQPYFKADEVKQKIPNSQVIYRQVGSKTSQCSIVGTAGTSSVSIFAGMDYTPLVCPIICADPNQPFNFYHNNQQLVPDGRNEWTYIKGIRISKTGNVIEFPAELFKRNSGEYRCEAGGQKFTFNAQVVAMPQFVTKLYEVNKDDEVSGNLPQTIYAMENETLSYNCTVYFTNMGGVTMEPTFYTAGTSGSSQSWKQFSLADFNRLFRSAEPAVQATPAPRDESHSLNITIPSVPVSDPSTYLNFTHRVVCEASVSAADAQKIGLPSYSVQSGSNVVFLKRPSLANFDLTGAPHCGVQTCSNGAGARFVVALRPELSAQLAQYGVQVSAFFKIDNDQLANNHLIKSVSNVSFDPTANRLSFAVSPFDDAGILAELQKHRTLTPVFNFAYRTGSPGLQNLRLHKDRYGDPDVAAWTNDCRADRLCFYSTDFDTASSLGGLVIRLGFVEDVVEVPVPAAASAGLIAGVSLAVLILIIVIVLLVFLFRRDPGQTYMVDEKERQQGNHPELEVKEEQFKEYQRPEEAALQARRMSMQSNVSVVSRDDQELDQYRDDDLDYRKFTEDGSFIGDYSAEDEKSGKKKKAGGAK